jgi:hypothetical protein
MNAKSLAALVAVALVALLAALWVTAKRPPDSTQLNQPLIANLQQSLNQINRVRVSKAGNQTVATLQRGERTWTVAEKSGYPADMVKLRALLLGLANAIRREEKTANPASYERLGIQDVSEATASGVRIELEGLAEPLAVIIGNADTQTGNGTFVRRTGEAQSWLVSANLSVPKETWQWLEPALLDIPAERIQTIVLRHPDGTLLTVTKDNREQANFTVLDIPAGRELQSVTIANPLASLLTALHLEDVVPLAQLNPADHPGIEAEYRTFDGLRISAKAFTQTDKHYAHFTVAFDVDQAQRFAKTASQGVDSATKPEKPANTEEAIASQRKTVELLNTRLSPWVYAIAAFKYDNLNKRLDDLLKPVENAAAKPEAQTQNPVTAEPEAEEEEPLMEPEPPSEAADSKSETESR